MTVQHYELGPDATLLDRATLRVFRWWRGSGRDFLSSYFLTQLLLVAILVVPLGAVPVHSVWNPIGAVAAVLAPVAAWKLHRRRHDWKPATRNKRARAWGIGLGVLLVVVTGPFIAVPYTYIAVAISMLATQGPLGLIPSVATGAAGWGAATYRKRQIDDPVYP